MISILLYGRNDAHGYNLHRRAALSLNCLAETLTADDDEIVFVDYNTPDELPTFVEALSDTLTPRCLERLRVLRVRPAVHRERFAASTHLPAVEPVCRNAAARRANPANRWLLSTNTDMILVPRRRDSFTDVCGEIADGAYGLPRFELPEWLWEQLPRTRPREVIEELGELGPRLHLDEATIGDEWILFDAPGDFQLCLRDDFVAIDGFDERMLLGWHVDSNFSRRMFLHRGSISSLDEEVAGYHCNHSRTPTVYHGPASPANDLTSFYHSVEAPPLPDQRESWGLADVALEEVSTRPRASVAFRDAVVGALPPAGVAKAPSSFGDAIVGLTYDSAHVMPFVVDSLAVSSRDVRIGYLGANDALRRMLQDVCARLDLQLLCADDPASAESFIGHADVVVVDLGLDAASGDAASVPKRRAAEWVPPFPRQLRSIVAALVDVVQQERIRLEHGAQPTRFVLVHSSTVFTNAYVLGQFDCSYTSTHSRIRRATVKPAAPSGQGTRPVLFHADRLENWSTRFDRPPGHLDLRMGEPIEIGELTDFSAFGDGWALPDADAIWTQGILAKLALRVSGNDRRGRRLTLTFVRVSGGAGGSLRARISVDGRQVAARHLEGGTRRVSWHVELPSSALAQETFELGVHVEPPTTWHADERRLGLHLRALQLERGGMLGRGHDAAQAVREVIARARSAARSSHRRRRPNLYSRYSTQRSSR